MGLPMQNDPVCCLSQVQDVSEHALSNEKGDAAFLQS